MKHMVILPAQPLLVCPKEISKKKSIPSKQDMSALFYQSHVENSAENFNTLKQKNKFVLTN